MEKNCIALNYRIKLKISHFEGDKSSKKKAGKMIPPVDKSKLPGFAFPGSSSNMGRHIITH